METHGLKNWTHGFFDLIFFKELEPKPGYQQNERTGPIQQAPSSKLSKVIYLFIY